MSDLAYRPIFDWPYFSLATDYQDNSTRVAFGKGYTFAARPEGPPQRLFMLKFEALIWELGTDSRPDIFTRRETNLGRLEDFYRQVEMWKTFWFPHPHDGLILVRFSKPLRIPHGAKGGTGAVLSLDIELIEQVLAWPTPVIPEMTPSMDSSLITMDANVYTMDQV